MFFAECHKGDASWHEAELQDASSSRAGNTPCSLYQAQSGCMVASADLIAARWLAA